MRETSRGDVITIVSTTGEVVEPLGPDEAERLTTRIGLRLETIADNYVAVMPMIREAAQRQAWLALGYTSVSAYMSDRFGGALDKLGVDMRRQVVRELTEVGMSTRAIAPVVGVSQKTVVKDLQVIPQVSRDDMGRPFTCGNHCWHVPIHPRVTSLKSPKKVVGIDGKTYTRPATSLPSPEVQPKPRRRSLPDQYRDAVYELRRAVECLERLTADERFARNRDELFDRHNVALGEAAEKLHDVRMSQFSEAVGSIAATLDAACLLDSRAHRPDHRHDHGVDERRDDHRDDAEGRRPS